MDGKEVLKVDVEQRPRHALNLRVQKRHFDGVAELRESSSEVCCILGSSVIVRISQGLRKTPDIFLQSVTKN